MNIETIAPPPEKCPSCSGELEITRLECSRCGTLLNGHYSSGRLVNLDEPYASVLELFLKVRGNVKDMERQLGLSYPTVRARLEEAFDAAGLARSSDVIVSRKERQKAVLNRLHDGELSATEAIEQLRKLKQGSRHE